MYFLVQIKINKNGSVDKGTSSYDTLNDAIIQLHTSMASAMSKEDTKKCTCVILDENGITMKSEFYEVPVVESVEE